MPIALAVMLLLGADAGVSLEAPLECPDGRWMADRVEAYLGPAHREAGLGGVEIAIDGRIWRQGPMFELELVTVVDGAREHHRLHHHDCAALIELGASLAAISIDPLVMLEPRSPTLAPAMVPVELAAISSRTPGDEVVVDDVPEVADAPAPITGPVEERPPIEPIEPLAVELYADPNSNGDLPREPFPPNEPGTRMLIEASGDVALNLFPNPAPSVRAGLGVDHTTRRVGVRAELVGEVLPSGRFRSADGAAGGDLLAWDLAVRPCAVPRWGIVDLRACGTLGAGQIRARGIGVDPSLRRSHPWVWAAVGLGLAFEVQTHVALVLDIDAQANLLRPSFSISSPDAGYVTPVVTGRAGLGVELRFF